MKLFKIYEASEQAIKKFIEDNEEWIQSSSSPEEQRQKINYLMKIGSLTSDDNHLFANYGNKQNLKNLKLQSKESYGWLDELSPEEKDIELNDPNLKPEYDFHKNLMKTNFQNPKSTNLKIYLSLKLETYIETDNANSILNKEKLDLKEVKEIDKNRKISIRFINSKGIIPYTDYSATNPVKIINSTFMVKESESWRSFYDVEIINSNIVLLEKENPKVINQYYNNIIGRSKIINSNIKCSRLDIYGSNINKCNLQLNNLFFEMDDKDISNIEIIDYSKKFVRIRFRKNTDLVILEDFDDNIFEVSLEEFQQKFAKK